MRYLLGFNWLMLAAACTMAVVLSVVLLIYWVYRAEPIIQASFDSLLAQTAIFVGYACLTALSAQSLRKRWRGFWLFQFAMFSGLVAIVNYYLPG